jgi:hypothetical protein
MQLYQLYLCFNGFESKCSLMAVSILSLLLPMLEGGGGVSGEEQQCV